ncbi:MAG: thiamine phosphate synthase [Planctomycetes bacterium]|nr:thiamine phosphate synthase [Planctomycetota bacterium]
MSNPSQDPTPDSETISLAESSVAHRIMDANLNRALEALRTLEDLMRFRDHPTAQFEFKRLRHQLAMAIQPWNQIALLTSRDADGDVGQHQKTETEMDRASGFVSIAHAAANRLQQSLRCLEEVAKFQYPDSAREMEALRYRSYDIHARAILRLQRDSAFLQNARLYVLVDCQLDRQTFIDRIRSIAEGGVDLIQIRDKRCDALQLIDYTTIAREATSSLPVRIFVNDRADVAVVAKAHGLHVGQTDLTVHQARRFLTNDAWVGLSTHDLDQVEHAIQVDADYVGCGPTFPSVTKTFKEYSGLDFLTRAAPRLNEAKLPAFAIGGIRSDNLALVLQTGIERVAVSHAIWNATSPRDEARRMRDLLG